MLLTENIAFRVREWMDRETPEPDLVPRFRRLWTEPHVTPARERAPGLYLHAAEAAAPAARPVWVIGVTPSRRRRAQSPRAAVG